MSWRRVRAIVTKEMRDYRRNRSVIVTMAVFPLVLTIQPLLAVFVTHTSAASSLLGRHELLFMLAIPILIPATLAAFAVAGERQQETLEPMLTTPITRDEFLLGKAIAVFVPAVAISYVVAAVFIALIELFAEPAVATAMVGTGDLVAQIVFTPLLAGWSILVGLAVSTRASDVRVAQQFSVVGNLPLIVLGVLVGLGRIEPTFELALLIGGVLLIADIGGWLVIARLFDREKLISGAH